MAGTKAPSGLYISREGYAYTFNWKIGDSDYNAGQQLQWRVNTGKWLPWWNLGVGTGTTSKKVTLNANQYWPKGKLYLFEIQFRVRGRKSGCDWSGWSTNGWKMIAPGSPSVTAELDDELENVCTFGWNYDASNTNNFPFTDVEWQSILVKDSGVTDGSKLRWNSSVLGWQTGTGGKTGTKEITEDTALLAVTSYTRWFRCRTRGIGGNGGVKGCSYWRYTKHVYATPLKPIIKSWSSRAGRSASADVTVMTVSWYANWGSAGHPIDKVEVQWGIGVPEADLYCPRALNWQVGSTTRDTPDLDSATFSIAQDINLDECLFARVAAYHDKKVTYSDAVLVRKWRLKVPSGLSVQTNETTHRATVTATNNSELPDSKLAVLYMSTNVEPFVIGFIPHGSSSVTVQCPDWTGESAISFGVYAYQGEETAITRADGIPAYAVNANIESFIIWDNGTVPKAPTDVNAELSETEGEVILTWNWTWSDADSAEISWSTNQNAWESTDEPQSYMISNLHAAKWRVSGLEMGMTWYFRVRLVQMGSDEPTYGPYSEYASADLSSAPSVPTLKLSAAVIPQSGSVTASWEYVSTDGTQQAYAEICEATISGETITYGSIIASATEERHVLINAQDEGWTTGQAYNLAVRVTSESNHISPWSDPIPVVIAEPVTCEIEETSFDEVAIDDGDGGTKTVTALTQMPLTLTVTGAGEGGTTAVAIERRTSYMLDRPDESMFNGYEGETIVIYTQSGEAEIEIGRDMLIGTLDDGAQYRLIAMTSDSYGQSAEQSMDFEVHWRHQAVVPNATVNIDSINMIARITPVAPAGVSEGDTCDIYRLSADRPVLVVQNGLFGTEYVDPYPTIGNSGGYRFVFMTEDGDYITAGNKFAWRDVAAGLQTDATIIDFGGYRAVLRYNMEVSHSWEKDFTETTYLGGAVQGDWNLSVHRRTSVSADSVVIDDPELITVMRRLAAYAGVCHVRTVDGSTFTADVQVSEDRSYDEAGKIARFSIDIKQVDSQQIDGMTYEEWHNGLE